MMETAWKCFLALMLLLWYFFHFSCVVVAWSFEPEQRTVFFPLLIFQPGQCPDLLHYVTKQMIDRGQVLGEGAGDCLSHQSHLKSCVRFVQPQVSEMQARVTEMNINKVIHQCGLGSTQHDLRWEKYPNIETCLDLSGHKSSLKSECNQFYLSSVI